MTWFKVDDSFHAHPKLMALSFAARGLWVTAGSWSAHYLTDGVVKSHVTAAWRVEDTLIGELVGSGLWEPIEGGWRFHDWQKYQPSKAEILAKRAATTERKRKSRETSTAVTRDLPTVYGGHASPDPVPSRPVLSPSEKSLNLSTTAASSVACESGGGFIEIGDPIRAQASRGRKRLNEIPPGLGLDFDHGGKWQAPLATIARYPEAEWAIAAATIARVVTDKNTRGFITPQHIVDYWALYSVGQTPGGKSAARGGRPANYQGPKVSAATLERAYAERKDARAALAKCLDPSERYTLDCKLAELESRIPRLEAAE